MKGSIKVLLLLLLATGCEKADEKNLKRLIGKWQPLGTASSDKATKISFSPKDKRRIIE